MSEAVAALRALGSLPGVVTWTVAPSLDTRKGRILVEDATFIDEEAFLRWRASPDHRSVAERMSTISDWWVGDWLL